MPPGAWLPIMRPGQWEGREVSQSRRRGVDYLRLQHLNNGPAAVIRSEATDAEDRTTRVRV